MGQVDTLLLGQVEAVYQLNPQVISYVVFLFSEMPRNYKKKTERGETPIDIFERAYKEIKNGRMSIREAAKTFAIDKMTLYRYKVKREKHLETPEAVINMFVHFKTIKPFQNTCFGYYYPEFWHRLNLTHSCINSTQTGLN